MGAHAYRYQLERELGAGAMGVVYEATDTRSGGRVAVKKLKIKDPDAIARFKNEFRALADVAHPNLVSLYELLVEDGELVLSMELIEGRDLNSWLRPFEAPAERADNDQEGVATRSVAIAEATGLQQTQATASIAVASPALPGSFTLMPEPTGDARLPDLLRVRQAFAQLAAGIAAIHRQGMLHRDVKPSNVMVTDDGRVVLLDFGIITSLEQAAGDDVEPGVVGTPAYMAPEQAAGRELTPASDWYSVGVVLYRALCGALPFTGRSDAVMAMKQVVDPTPVEKQARGVPEDLANLCNRLLARDPTARPGEREILRRLGAADEVGGPWTTGMTTSVGHLVGRSAELARLHETIAEARRGARCAVVSGASGIGKTRLVNELADTLRADRDGNALVLAGRCRERESIAFKALDQVVDLFVAHLATLRDDELAALAPADAQALAVLFPVFRRLATFSSHGRPVRGVAGAEVRRRGFAAFRDLVAAFARTRPLVMLIDDVQWGDEDSAQLLIDLARGPASPRLAIVVAHRDEDESAFANRLRDLAERESIACDSVVLAPLGRDASIRLALGALGHAGDPAAKAERIADEANGNPLFIEELAQHAGIVDGGGDLSLEGVLRARVGRLPEPAARLLEFIAVPGQLVPLSNVIRAAGRDDPSAMGVLRAGSFVRARQLRGARAVECYHNRIRDLVIEDLPRPRRIEVSLQWVKALEQLSSPDPELLAVLCDEADEPLLAAEHWRAAARRAEEGLAFAQAAHLYGRAAERLETGSREWSEATESMAQCFRIAGRGADAAKAFTRAAEHATGHSALEFERLAADSLLKSGCADEGRQRGEAILRSVGVSVPQSKLATLARYVRMRMRVRSRGLTPSIRDESEIPRAELFQFDALNTLAEGLSLAEPLMAATLQSQAAVIALDLGEPRRLTRALLGEAATTTMKGPSNHERTRAVLDLMAELAETDGSAASRGHVQLAEGWAAFQEGRWSDAADWSVAALGTYRNHTVGQTFEISLANQFACFAMPFCGRTAEVDALVEQTLRDARERGDVLTEVNILVGLASHGCIRRGQPELAYRVVDEALDKWSPRGFQLQHYNALFARLAADLHLGDFARAQARIDDRWSALENSMMMRVQVLRVQGRVQRGRLALAEAEADRVEPRRRKALLRLAARIGARLSREAPAYARALGTALTAGVQFQLGDREAGLGALAGARRLFESAGMPTYALAATAAELVASGADAQGDELARLYETVRQDHDVREPGRVLYCALPGFGPVDRTAGRLPDGDAASKDLLELGDDSQRDGRGALASQR